MSRSLIRGISPRPCVVSLVTIGLSLTLSLHAQQSPANPAGAASENEAEQAVELNPFVVSETDNAGYSANSTLAGTRLNTALRDIGASISIVTPEFMEDIAATEVSKLLTFTAGTEAGGMEGNFAGGESVSGRPDQSESRENPQNNQRVRGIGPAANTRNFFLTDIPLDSYNTARVTINRGPNSLLFGIGNPAGVIDTSLIRPTLNRNRTTLGIRFGSEESWRTNIDHNQVIVRERLGVRLAAVDEDSRFAQEPAFNRERRFYGALGAVLRKGKPGALLGRTSLDASFETGDGESRPVNVIPPADAYGIFYGTLDPSIDSLPGVDITPAVLQGSAGYIWSQGATVDNRINSTSIPQNVSGYYGVPYFIQIPLVFDSPNQISPGFSGGNPALNGVAGVMGRIRYAQGFNGRGPVDAISTRSIYSNVIGFVTPTIQDRDIFDYRKRLISGESNLVERDFDAKTIALTQELLGGDAGFEAAFDQQDVESSRELPFSFGQNGAGNGQADVFIDVSQYLSNDQPNPNLGRPFIQQLGVQDRIQQSEREAFRATAFYQLNLEKKGRKLFGIPLGNHTFTGLFTNQEVERYNQNYQSGWESATRNLNTTVFQENLSGGFRRAPLIIQYVGPSVLGTTSADQFRITDVFTGNIPRDGESYNVTFFDSVARRLATERLTIRRFLNGASRSRQEVESQSFSIKSDFFSGNLVGIVGWRNDKLQTFSSEGNTRLPDGTLDPESTRLRADPDLDESVNNFTWSVVGHLPEKWSSRLPLGLELSAYYNESGNFNPTGVNTDLRGAIIEAPAGETKEYGLLFEFLNRRASLRLNWFETVQTNTRNNAGGATAATYNFPNFMISRYRAAETQSIAFSTIPGVTAAGYTSYDQLYAAFGQLLPEPTNTLKNIRRDANGEFQFDGLQGLSDTTNLSAEGFEAELVGNLSRSWRVAFNVAQQETTLSGTAALTKSVAEYVFAKMGELRLLGIDQGPALPERQTASTRFVSDIQTPLAATLARDGTPSLEQRKWRANFVTSYDFRHMESSWLRRFSVGTGVRWQDKAAIGTRLLTGERLKQKIVEIDPNFTDVSQIADNASVMQTQYPDLDNLIYGPAEFNGDVWIAYRRKIANRIDWTLRLNVSNAWGNSDDIPVTANPDGSIAVIRIPNETRWYLSSKFTF